jgi:hypothetical protein
MTSILHFSDLIYYPKLLSLPPHKFLYPDWYYLPNIFSPYQSSMLFPYPFSRNLPEYTDFRGTLKGGLKCIDVRSSPDGART